MLGEIRFYQKNTVASSSKLHELLPASLLVAQSLAMIDPTFDAATVKPIAYRLPTEIPGPAMTRAVLAELRNTATMLADGALDVCDARWVKMMQTAPSTS